jgi:glycosyltransferase involved in cell wall biosynthesis
MTSFSIIVINKNRDFSLDRCLQSIIKQLDKNDELIVVDDNSDDNSQLIIQKNKDKIDRIIQVDSKGNRALVRNSAANTATREILLYIDSDVIIGPDNLNKTRIAHKDQDIVATNGNVFGNSHDIAQFEMVTHMKFEEFLHQFDNDFSVLFTYDYFFDYRFHNTNATIDSYTNWFHFFTSYASITRKSFL